MVSKYLIGAAFLLAGVNAEAHEFKGPAHQKENFEPALIAKDTHYESKKDYEFKKDVGIEVAWEEVKKTYSCCEKHPHLFMFKDEEKYHVTCTKTEYKNEDTFKAEEKWTLNGEEVKEIKEQKFAKATHHHGDAFELLLQSLKESKTDLKEAAADKETACAIGTKKEVKKEDEKKGDKKEEEKVEYEWKYTIVGHKDHSIGKEMTTVKIFGKEYLAFCGPEKDVKEKVLKYKKEEGSCCSCAWYVWVIVAVVIVGAGVGAYFVLKEDKEEDEYEAEYGTA